MNTLVTYLWALPCAALLGFISAIIVFSLAAGAERYCGFHREMFIAGLTLLGGVTCVLAKHYDQRWLGIAILLCAWVALIPLAILAIGVWRSFGFAIAGWRDLSISLRIWERGLKE